MALFKDSEPDTAQADASIQDQIETSNQTMQQKRDKLYQSQLDLIKGESASYTPESISYNGGTDTGGSHADAAAVAQKSVHNRGAR